MWIGIAILLLLLWAGGFFAFHVASLQQQFPALFTELRKCLVAEGIENPSIASGGLFRSQQTGFDPTEHGTLP